MADKLVMQAELVEDITRKLRGISDELTKFSRAPHVRHIKNELTELREHFQPISEELRELVIPALTAFGLTSAGVVASVHGMAAALGNLARQRVELQYMSREMRVGSGTLAAFQRALEQFNVPAERSGRALQAFGQRMRDFRYLQTGNYREFFEGRFRSLRPYAERMQKLAFQGKDEQALNETLQMLGRIDKLYGDMEAKDVAEYIFGDREVARLAIDNLKTYQQQLEDINKFTLLDPEQAQAYIKQFSEFQHLLDSIKVTVATGILKPFNEALKDLVEYLRQHQTDIQEWVTTNLESFEQWTRTDLPEILKGLREFFNEVDHVVRMLGGWKTIAEALIGIKLAQWIVALTAATRGLFALAAPPWLTALMAMLSLKGDRDQRAEQWGALRRMGITDEEMMKSDFLPVGSVNGELQFTRQKWTMDQFRKSLGFPTEQYGPPIEEFQNYQKQQQYQQQFKENENPMMRMLRDKLGLTPQKQSMREGTKEGVVEGLRQYFREASFTGEDAPRVFGGPGGGGVAGRPMGGGGPAAFGGGRYKIFNPAAGGAGGGGGGPGGGRGGVMTRGDRNHNPGNIKMGPFAVAHGATGQDEQGHAIFPDYQTGRGAMESLLQGKYAGQSIAQIGSKYAEDAGWAGGVSRAMGVSPNYVPNMNDPQERKRFADAIMRQEGTHRPPHGPGQMFGRGGAAGGAGRANFFSGAPPSAASMERVKTAAGAITVNQQSAPHLAGFVNELAKEGAPLGHIGSYNARRIAGSGRWSQHSYGNALDLGNQSARNVVSPEFRNWVNTHGGQWRSALNKYGIISGGDWRNPDLGHVEWGGTRRMMDEHLARQDSVHKVEGTGHIRVDVNAPANTKVKGSPGGLFRHIEMHRRKQMEHNAPGAPEDMRI